MEEITVQMRNHTLIFDKEGYDLFMQHQWYYKTPKNITYIYTFWGERQKQCYFHTIFMGKRDGLVIDHINGNGLDNRRENLRFCTTAQNMWNQGVRVTNKCGFKGVSLYRKSGKWLAQIQKNGKKIHIGHFNTPEEASLAYISKAKELHGEYARFK